MSAFKKFDRKDVFTTVHLAYKNWFSSGSNHLLSGVEFFKGTSGSYAYPGDFSSTSSLKYTSYSYDQLLYYHSIRQLYYGNVSENFLTGSFEEYLQSSLYSGSRSLPTSAGIVSIPKQKFGIGINPGSIDFNVDTSYIENESDYVLETIAAGGEYIENLPSGSIVDEEGQLRVTETFAGITSGSKVGDIFYNHGLLVFTDEYLSTYFSNAPTSNFSWESMYPVYTTAFKCKVRDYELNYSLNPSSIKDEYGSILDTISGSEFKPYVTTVGLYNDSKELLAVAKLGQPIPKSIDTDMTFVIKLDI